MESSSVFYTSRVPVLHAVGIVLAVTSVATHLISFFTIVGASFGPICGAMAADYLLSGKK